MWWWLAATVGVLVVARAIDVLAPWLEVVSGIGLTAAALVIALEAGLTRRELGLAPATWPAGLRWGGVLSGIVALCYTVALVVPAAREAVTPSGTAWPQAFGIALVTIPLATVFPEEIVFRGVVLGLLRRRMGDLPAIIGASVLFGLWHVPTVFTGGAANDSVADAVGAGAGTLLVRVLATVAFTGLAGAGLCVLRLRSTSLLAPILLHWAVNGLGVLFVVAVGIP